MAASRTPGPLGIWSSARNLDDAVSIPTSSAPPGPVEMEPLPVPAWGSAGQASWIPPRSVRRPRAAPAFLTLRLGSQGAAVEQLQRLLNRRCVPSPTLAVDGRFGPVTQGVLQQFQTAVSIASDGVAGKDTWFYLLSGSGSVMVHTAGRLTPPASGGRQAALRGPQAAVLPGPAPAPAVAKASALGPDVADWPLDDKFAEALRRTAPKLPVSMRHEFEALLSPSSLTVMVGALVAWAGSHAFGVGELVDVLLLAGGVFFLGLAAFDAAGELGDFVLVTSDASRSEDLDDAASHLARAIAMLGVTALFALLARLARSGRGSGKPAGGEAARKVSPATSQAAAGPSAKPPRKPPERPLPEQPTTARVKFGQRAPGVREAGAEPPTKALLQEVADAKSRAGLPPPQRTGWPDIDAGSAATFKRPPEAVELPEGTKLFRVIDSQSNPNGAYWSTNNPTRLSEAQWRSGSAVKGEWNGDGAYVEYEVPRGGLKVWSGEAAPQVSSDGANILRGGGNQVWLPPGTTQASPAISTGFQP